MSGSSAGMNACNENSNHKLDHGSIGNCFCECQENLLKYLFQHQDCFLCNRKSKGMGSPSSMEEWETTFCKY